MQHVRVRVERAAGFLVAYVSPDIVDQSSEESYLLAPDVRTRASRAVDVVEGECACWTDLLVAANGGVAWIRRAVDEDLDPVGPEWAAGRRRSARLR